MQMTMDQAMRPGLLQAFALRRGSGYVMRSEKRPSYGGGGSPNHRGGKRRPKRPKAGIVYILFTLLILVILWPIGLVMLWSRKVRMQAGTKLLISLLTLCVSVFLIVFALTVSVDNPQFTQFQDKANDWLNHAAADIAVAGDATYKKSVETWGVMTEFVDTVSQPMLNTVADGIDKGVELAGNLRSGIQSLTISAPTPEPSAVPTESSQPDPTPVAIEPAPTREIPEIRVPENTPDPETARVLTPGSFAGSEDAQVEATPSSEPTETAEATEVPAEDEAPVEAEVTWSPSDDAAAASLAPEVTPEAEPEPIEIEAKSTEDGEPEAEPTEEPVQTEEPEVEATEEPEATAEPTPEPTEEPEATEEPTPEPTEAPGATEAPTAKVTEEPEVTEATEAPAETESPNEGDAAIAVKAPGEARVYYHNSSRFYHTKPSCQNMSNAPAHTLSEAITAGKSMCNTCKAPDAAILSAKNVVWADADNVFHTTDECEAFRGSWKLITLDDAIGSGYTACPDCQADAFAALNAEPTPTPEPTPTATPEPTAVPTPSPTPEARVIAPAATLKPVGDVTVYHSSNGKFYHRHQICKGMTGSRPYKFSEITSKYRRCKTCDAPDMELIGKTCLWMDENGLCHTSDTCEKFSGEYTFILRDDALAQGKDGCPDCGADEYLIPNTVLAE